MMPMILPSIVTMLQLKRLTTKGYLAQEATGKEFKNQQGAQP